MSGSCCGGSAVSERIIARLVDTEGVTWREMALPTPVVEVRLAHIPPKMWDGRFRESVWRYERKTGDGIRIYRQEPL